MNKNSLKENLIFQGLYQIIRIITPIITIPIISRAFGPSGVGVTSFSFTIVQYFLMFSGLGIQLYFNRLIAENDANKAQLSKTFWNIFMSKAILSVVVLILYIITIHYFITEYRLIFYLQGVFIVGSFFDISWYYAGMERFKLPSIINMLMSMLVLIVVVGFVHDQSDMALYVFIIAAITVFNQIPLYFNVFKEISFITIDWQEVWTILKTSFAYFLPNGQLNLFTSINCLIIGLMMSYRDVGIFANTFNILTVAIILINTIDLVMIPRLTRITREHNHSIQRILENNMHIQLMLTIPMVFGIIAIMPDFYQWFFGKAFYESVPLMTVLSILLLIIPLNMMISRQYLLSQNMVKSYNLSLIAGGILNIICSIVLVLPFGLYGIGLARIVAELMILIWRWIDIRKLNIVLDYRNIIKALRASAVMYLSIMLVAQYLHHPVITTFIEIMTGIMLYLVCNLILRNKYLLIVLNGILRRERSS
ncbi:lipopolysaccharide biosynthesis protein [Staphylococcus simulans]|uniref:oligosaccharide flippase family protein n=1 Tax=Staphylococcus simulans TaxID=1286 RepID=UPI001E5F1E56|nr:lipopolysaccharide biosynthesis protein [Staphylococcus simulans]MCD8914609.1 lipopolysaccharide biosynthesis protein [Staphylococcus simulans]